MEVRPGTVTKELLARESRRILRVAVLFEEDLLRY